MIALTIILGVLALGLLIVAACRYATVYEGFLSGALGVLVGVVWLVMFSLISNVRFSDQSLTGYIYSQDTFAGVTQYHIRFSENAGADSQPSFCVNEDASSKRQLDELVGSSRKVTVEIPPVGWYFADDLWHCPSNAQLKSAEPAKAP